MKNRYAFTLIEILSALGIIAVLAAIAFPVFGAARRRSQATTCLSNVRHISMAMQSYMEDYDGSYPAALTATFVSSHAAGGVPWYITLQPYTNNHRFICPTRWTAADLEDPASGSYAINLYLNDIRVTGNQTNYAGSHESKTAVPASTITVFDVRAGIIALDEPDTEKFPSSDSILNNRYDAQIRSQKGGAFRHDGGANYAFADGHAKWLRPGQTTVECKDNTPCFEP